jgi:DNA polymerase-1
LPVTFLSIDGIEADDTITYISEMYKDTSKRITIVSTDRDFYQLINDKVQIWSPIKKQMYTVETVINEFGIHPNNYVVYRSFTGDKSDNIPGISGIGPKTILKLLPELTSPVEFGIDQVIEKSTRLLTESTKYKTISNNKEILYKNFLLMNLKELDIPAQNKSNIRKIVESEIPMLNKNEFRKLFMEDKMWTTMKNLPDWLNTTWLSLSAFAQQTNNLD